MHYFLFPERDITDTAIDFTWDGEFNQALLSGIGETITAVEGMDQILGAIEVDVGGIKISMPAGAGLDPANAVEVFLANASESDIANVNEAFNLSLPAGAIQNDDTLRRNLMSYFTAVRDAPDGEGPGPFDMSYTPGDWFGRLDPTVQSGIMSLLGTANFSPERSAGGTSALASIGRAFGIGAGAVIGTKLGIGPEAGAALGAAATGG